MKKLNLYINLILDKKDQSQKLCLGKNISYTLYKKILGSFTPLNCALSALIFALKEDQS